jgi:hypothetical protein
MRFDFKSFQPCAGSNHATTKFSKSVVSTSGILRVDAAGKQDSEAWLGTGDYDNISPN